MEKTTRMITWPRLIAAADALLEAISSTDGMQALVEVRMDEPAEQDSVSGPFTQDEFMEAMSMLVRMGLVPSNGSGLSRAA